MELQGLYVLCDAIEKHQQDHHQPDQPHHQDQPQQEENKMEQEQDHHVVETPTIATIPIPTPVEGMDTDTYVKTFNQHLPCRVRFIRNPQTRLGFIIGPGPETHTGWLMKVGVGPKRDLELHVAFQDFLTLDGARRATLVTGERPWMRGSLCAFIHTCYWNWDVTGSVKSKSFYTRPVYDCTEIEVLPDKFVRLSKFIPKNVQHLEKIPRDIDFPWSSPSDCPVAHTWTTLTEAKYRRRLRGRGV